MFLLTNNTCTFLELKKRLFNPLVQLKELPLLNRNKKELITTSCEQLSSTEGAPTVTRSLVSLRSSFDLELTYNIGRKKEVGKRHYVEGSRRWLKTHSLFSLSLNYSILLTIQITLFFIRSRKLIRDALILLSFFRGESVVMEKA